MAPDQPHPLEKFLQTLQNAYLAVEDSYYDILDGLENKNIPIYRLVDLVDEKVPSFVLFTCIFLILVALFGWFVFLKGGQELSLIFAVVDPSSNPIDSATLKLKTDGNSLTVTTDKFGTADIKFADGKLINTKTGETLSLPEGALTVEALKTGFEANASLVQIPFTDNLFRITLTPLAAQFSASTRTLLIRDQNDRVFRGTTKLGFSCENPEAKPPSSMTTDTGQVNISVSPICGALTARVNAEGYEEGIVVIFGSSAVIKLNPVELEKGKVLVTVKDLNENPLTGIEVKLYSSPQNVLIDQGLSDSSGKYVFEVLPRTYSVTAYDSTGAYITATAEPKSLKANDRVEFVIYMQQETTAKKLFFKIVDSNSDAPIQNAELQIFLGEQLLTSVNSDTEGFATISASDSAEGYKAVISHPDYLTNTVENAMPVLATDETPTVVQLERMSAANSGTIRVIVKDSLGNFVDSARVFLRKENTTLNILEKPTGSDGVALFTNLLPGGYYAYVLKDAADANTATVTVAAGESKDLEAVLVLGKGSLMVTVVDKDNQPIAGAKVAFFSPVTNLKLGETLTDSQGKTKAVDFKVDKAPYMIVSKKGYLQTITPSYQIQLNTTQEITVQLQGEFDISDLAINLAQVYEADGQTTASSVRKGRNYVLKFNVGVPADGYTNVRALIRTGLQSEVNASNSAVVLKEVTAANSGITRSACFKPNDNYAACNPTDGDAKQVLIDFGDLNRGSYEIFATMFVRPVPSLIEGQSDIEIRYGIKADFQATAIKKPDATNLYLRKYTLAKSICQVACKVFEYYIKLQKGNSTTLLDIDNPNLTLNDKALVEDDSANFLYTIFNRSQTNYAGLLLSYRHDPAVFNFSSLSQNIPTLDGDSAFSSAVGFTALRESALTDVNFVLDVPALGNTKNIEMKVIGKKFLGMTVLPDSLQPNITNTLLINSIDANTNEIVPNAAVKIFKVNSATSQTQIVSDFTDDSGYFSYSLPAYAPDTKLKIVMQKPAYREGSKEIQVAQGFTEPPAPIVLDFSCIIVNPQQFNALRGSQRSFTVQTISCAEQVDFQLGRPSSSTINAAPVSFTLAKSASQTVTVAIPDDASYGLQEIYVTAKGKSDVASPMKKIASVKLTVAPGADECFYLLPPAEFNVLNSLDSGAIENRCLPTNVPAANLTTVDFPRLSLDSPLAQVEFTNRDSADPRKINFDVLPSGQRGVDYGLLTVTDIVSSGAAGPINYSFDLDVEATGCSTEPAAACDVNVFTDQNLMGEGGPPTTKVARWNFEQNNSTGVTTGKITVNGCGPELKKFVLQKVEVLGDAGQVLFTRGQYFAPAHDVLENKIGETWQTDGTRDCQQFIAEQKQVDHPLVVDFGERISGIKTIILSGNNSCYDCSSPRAYVFINLTDYTGCQSAATSGSCPSGAEAQSLSQSFTFSGSINPSNPNVPPLKLRDYESWPGITFTPSDQDMYILGRQRNDGLAVSSATYDLSTTSQAVIDVSFTDNTRQSTSADSQVVVKLKPTALGNMRSAEFLVKLIGGDEAAETCYTPRDVAGKTGPGAAPKIKYEWEFDDIEYDTCDANNSEAIYCDATQFTISLVKRLEQIRPLAVNPQANWDQIKALSTFEALLMKDGYSADFQADFDNYMNTQQFFTVPTYYKNSTDGWGLYVKNPAKLLFTSPAALPTNPRSDVVPLLKAGKYRTYLSFRFPTSKAWKFFENNAPIADINVSLQFLPGTEQTNIFYLLPINGEIGLQGTGSSMNRQGYGVAYTSTSPNIPIAIAGDKTISPVAGPSGTGIIKVTPSRIDAFGTVQDTDRGAVLTLGKTVEGTNLIYSPSFATPVGMRIQPLQANTPFGGFYYLVKNNIVQPGFATAANPNLPKHISYWGGAASTMTGCNDFDGQKLFYNRPDEAQTGTSGCIFKPIAPDKIFGFKYQEVQSTLDRTYVKTDFFTPINSAYALQNACTDSGYFVSPTSVTQTVNDTIPLSHNGQSVGSLNEILQSVRDRKLCMVENRDGTGTLIGHGIYWNQDFLNKQFDDSAGINDPRCAGVKRQEAAPVYGTEASVCQDTDGGKVYETAGTVIISSADRSGTTSDLCQPDGKLMEVYCENNRDRYEIVSCPSGKTCMNNACVAPTGGCSAANCAPCAEAQCNSVKDSQSLFACYLTGTECADFQNCDDDDNGKIYDVKGTVRGMLGIGGGTTTQDDVCMTTDAAGKKLIEWFCDYTQDPRFKTNVNHETYVCPGRCLDGECVS